MDVKEFIENKNEVYTTRVGSLAKQRHRIDRATILVHRSSLVVEYLGYIITFYFLMAMRVIPFFDDVSRYNPIEWAVSIQVFNDYLLFLGILLLLYAFLIIQNRLHSGKTDRSFREEYLFHVRAITISFLFTVGITFLLKTTFIYSRLTLILFLIAMLIESLLWIIARRALMRYLYQKGTISRNVLVIGAGRIGQTVVSKVVNNRSHENKFIGYLDDFKKSDEVIGRISDLERVLQQLRIDTVYVTIPSEKNLIKSMLRTVYKYNIDIRIIPEMFDSMSTVFAFRDDLEYPCLQLVKTPLRGLNVFLKRLADVSCSALLLILLSPIFLVIALLIRIDSKGNIFYKQKRIGKNGLPFYMIKFRSMYIGSDVTKHQLLKDNEMSGPVFKLRNDPRVTSVGKFLRKYSLDELPQLWNVLKGEMSLIGPRPPLPEEVDKYSDYHWRRMDVLPGMTGLWQVSGRSDLNFEQWIELDIYYIEHWSFALEMKILLKTIPVVIKGAGAY